MPGMPYGKHWRRSPGIAVVIAVHIVFCLHASRAASPGFDRYGGWQEVEGRKTGWFHLQEIDGRWWFVTPDGHAFFSNGLNIVRCDWDQGPAFQRKYGGAISMWAADVVPFLRAHHFNTIGSDHWDPAQKFLAAMRRIEPRLPYCVVVSAMPLGYQAPKHKKDWVWPDIFEESTARNITAKVAATAARYKDDPYLLGYYTHNEVEWGVLGPMADWMRSNLRDLPAASPWKRKLLALMQQRYGNNLKKFNQEVFHPDLYRRKTHILQAGWNQADFSWVKMNDNERRNHQRMLAHIAPLERWEDLITTQKAGRLLLMAKCNRKWLEDLEAMMGLVAERYAELHMAAFREYDAHHLVLGPRIAWGLRPMCPIPVRMAITKGFGIWCDDYYWNSKDADDAKGRQFRDHLFDIHEQTNVPILFSEFGGYMDRSLHMPGGEKYVAVDSQEERAARFRNFRNLIETIPFVVGAHYYSYADHAQLNWGVTNKEFEPYQILLDAMKEMHSSVYGNRLRHAGNAHAFGAGPP